jgi:hypothetical protein
MFMHIRASDPDSDWIRIQSGQWIRIRIRKCFPIFGDKNPGSGLDPDPDRYSPTMLDPDPYQMNMDPKP